MDRDKVWEGAHASRDDTGIEDERDGGEEDVEVEEEGDFFATYGGYRVSNPPVLTLCAENPDLATMLLLRPVLRQRLFLNSKLSCMMFFSC